jgi:hypothetical protein
MMKNYSPQEKVLHVSNRCFQTLNPIKEGIVGGAALSGFLNSSE